MALLRPTLILIFDLDEEVATEETVLELKRCYSYVCTTAIRTHAAHAESPRNIARFEVKMGTHRYLSSADADADETWKSIVDPWLRNMLHKVGNNMKIFNERQREIGLPEVVFDRADIVLQGGALIVGIHPDDESFIDPGLHKAIDAVRTFVNDGTCAQALRVDVPSDASWSSQRAAAWNAWVAEHPEALEPKPDERSAPDSSEPSGQEKTPEQLLQEDIEAHSYERTAVPPTDSDALPPIPHEGKIERPRFNFDVDYTEWAVAFADGSIRIFDSMNRTFIEASSIV